MSRNVQLPESQPPSALPGHVPRYSRGGGVFDRMVAATFLTVLGSCSPTEADEKDATAAIPFSEIGAKASADYQGDAAGGAP